MYTRLKNTRDDLNKKLEVLKKQEKLINEKIKKSDTGRVKVAGTIYPGVKII